MSQWLMNIASGIGEGIRSNGLLLMGFASIVSYYCGGLARKVSLPSIIGFMAVGVLLGPSFAHLFQPDDNLAQMEFITEIALALVAFTIGSELSLASLRRLGRGIIVIILAESLCAFFIVLLLVYLVSGNLSLALLFGAVAPASAPAGTVAVIQEYRARGTLTKALYAVVGFDDGLAIIIFGLAAGLAKTFLLADLGVAGDHGGVLAALAAPVLEIIISLGLGTVCGFLFCWLVKRLKEPRDMLIMIIGVTLVVTGLSVLFHLSLILTNMVMGFVLVNTRSHDVVQRVLAPLRDVMPLLFVLFFCLAGAHLDLNRLPSLGLIGVVYIFGRSAGLMGGAYCGAVVCRMEPKIRKYLGMGILSQAGVAIGLSLIIQQDMAELAKEAHVAAAMTTSGSGVMGPTAIGAAVITTITATCIVFEVVGPITTKIALRRAGEIGTDGAQRSQPVLTKG